MTTVDHAHTSRAKHDRRVKAEAIADLVVRTRVRDPISPQQRAEIVRAAGYPKASDETWDLAQRLRDYPLAVVALTIDEVDEYARREGLNYRQVVAFTPHTVQLGSTRGCRVRGVVRLAAWSDCARELVDLRDQELALAVLDG